MTPLRLAGLLLALVAVAGWQVTVIPASTLQSVVGATLVPAVVVAALGALGLMYAASAQRNRQHDEAAAPDQAPLPGSTARMLWLLGGGLAFMLLVRPLGFVVAGTLCGIGVARAFDAPLGLRNVAMNLAIALAFWLLFAQVLGVGLGPALAWPF
jgi:hypothetical protein